MVAPCKDCVEREIGCHSKCELYKEYVKYREIEREEIKAKRRELYGADDYEKAKMKRLRRYK